MNCEYPINFLKSIQWKEFVGTIFTFNSKVDWMRKKPNKKSY